MMNNQTLLALLATTPDSRLNIHRLTIELVNDDGTLKLDEAMLRHDEINVAVEQAKEYARGTDNIRTNIRDFMVQSHRNPNY